MKAILIRFLAFIAVSFAADVTSLSDSSDKPECKLLGFGESLACSTCKSFEDIIADEDLTKECLRCCKAKTRSAKKYTSATLVYDPRMLSADAELRGFVEDRAAGHPALELQPTLFAKTVLRMSEDGTAEGSIDTVSIRRWKVDSISDYLREHLE